MNSMAISLAALAFISIGALAGLFLSSRLPTHHLQGESRDVVKLGAGFIATLAALVLGLLVSSAKSGYDTMSSGLMEFGARIVVLDRTLARIGPEADPVRRQLRQTLADGIEKIWPTHGGSGASLPAVKSGSGMDLVQDGIRNLTAADDPHRRLLAEAQETANWLALSRWRLIENAQSEMPAAFLIVLVFWLSILFMSFGLLANRNATVMLALLVCAVSVSGAIFLILEMSQPMRGVMKLANTPLVTALELISR